MDDYKEKYENLIEQLKKAKEEYGGYTFSSVIDKIVPELKESEDEKIRKVQLDYWRSVGGKEWYGVPVQETIAWLEKQGEKRSADNAESKFKDKLLELFQRFRWCNKGEIPTNGDIIEYINAHIQELIDVNQNPTDLIEELQDYIKNTPSEQRNKDWNELESYSKPDTVLEHNEKENIKPKFEVGNWIVNNNGEPRVFRVEKQGWPDSIISSSLGNQFINTFTLDKQYHLWTIQDAKDGDVLATKKGNPFIYDKYRYNNGLAYYYAGLDVNKELTLKSPYTMLTHFGKLCSASPATKEQRDLLFQKMKEAGYEWDSKKKELKKIEQNPAWSEEDEKFLNYAISLTDDAQIKNFLKSIKERVQPQPKQEWSEEEGKNLSQIILLLDQLNHIEGFKGIKISNDIPSLINWLKSLKPNHWKPSEFQLKCLTKVIPHRDNEIDNELEYILTELYEQLKSL